MTRKEIDGILAQARVMDAQRESFERAKAAPRCVLCAAHYGDAGACDEGKPVNSPHRDPSDDERQGETDCVEYQ